MKKAIFVLVIIVIPTIVFSARTSSEEIETTNLITNPYSELISAVLFGRVEVEYERVISSDKSIVGTFVYRDKNGGVVGREIIAPIRETIYGITGVKSQYSGFGLGGGIEKYIKKSAPAGFWVGGGGFIQRVSDKYTFQFTSKEKNVIDLRTFSSFYVGCGYKLVKKIKGKFEGAEISINLGYIMGNREQNIEIREGNEWVRVSGEVPIISVGRGLPLYVKDKLGVCLRVTRYWRF